MSNIESTIEKAVQKALAEIVVPTPEYMNTKQAAVYIGFSKEFLEIARCKADGTGPAYIKTTSRSVRYAKRDLDIWMSRFRVEPGDAPQHVPA